MSFAVGLIVLLGLPPFAMFASELAIARSLADARLTWVLGAGMVLITIAFAALVRNSGRMLLGPAAAAAPSITVPATVAAALLVGVAASIDQFLGLDLDVIGGTAVWADRSCGRSRRR